MQKPYKSIRVFKSPILERLTHVHPTTPFIVWVPIMGYLMWRSVFLYQLSVYEIVPLGVFGFIVWTLAEYVLHRFVFHYEAETRFGQWLHFLIHGLHHDDPVDPTRLVMPPVASLALGVGLYSIFRLFLGPVYVEPFFVFFALGYLCYDYIHYAVHHFSPRTKLGRMLKQSHMQHHYVCPDSRWGVSSPMWDYVFGTMEPVKKDREARS